MKISKLETERRKYGVSDRADLTPYFFDNGTKFIGNLITNATDETFYTEQQRRDKLAQAIRDLRSNNYKLICQYGRHKSPFDFLKWVKAEGHSLQRWGKFFTKHGTRTIFFGNVLQYSAAFKYVIYDKNIIRRLKAAVKNLPQVIHY